MLHALQQRIDRKSGFESVGATGPKLAIARTASVTAAANMDGRVQKEWIIGKEAWYKAWLAACREKNRC